MAIVSNIKTYPVSWLIKKNKSGKLNDNISIQRKEVWDIVYKSNLIISILSNVSLEGICLESDPEIEEGFKIIDGKQRKITLCSFESDGFSLSPKMKKHCINGINLDNLFFSQLPSELQDRIRDYQLSITIYEPMTEEERRFVFFMKNQSVKLTKSDMLPTILGEEKMNEFIKLCSHPFFGKTALTKSAFTNRTDLKIMLQYFIVLTGRDCGLSSVEIETLAEEINQEQFIPEYTETVAILDYLNIVFAKIKQVKYLKTVNIPIIMYIAKQALDKEVKAEDFFKVVDNFFLYLNKESEYSIVASQGSAKKHNVQKRIEILGELIK